MDILALDDAYHHPTQRLEMPPIAPDGPTLTSDNPAAHYRGGKLESLFLPMWLPRCRTK